MPSLFPSTLIHLTPRQAREFELHRIVSLLCEMSGKSESQILRLVEEVDKENEGGSVNAHVSEKLRTFIRQTKVGGNHCRVGVR